MIRIRGGVEFSFKILDALENIKLKRNNYATLIADDPSMRGVLQKVKDGVAWGEASKDTILLLLREKGELEGGVKMTEDEVKKIGFKGIDDLAEALSKSAVKLKDVKRIKPFFRLHPPIKGFKKPVKRSRESAGETGYRGKEINALAARMV